MQHQTDVQKDFSTRTLTKLEERGLFLTASKSVPGPDNSFAYREYSLINSDTNEVFKVSFTQVLKKAGVRFK